MAGLHVPVMPSMEAAGRAGAADPWQSGPIAANVGVMELVMSISNVAGSSALTGSRGKCISCCTYSGCAYSSRAPCTCNAFS